MAKQLTVLERIQNLERNDEGLDEKLNSAFNQIRAQLTNAMEVVEALVGVTEQADPAVKDKIDALMKTNREKRVAERIEQETKQLAQMVEMGVLKDSAAVTENSLLVIRTFNASGEVMGIGREQIEFKQIHPSLSAEFLGKEVGYVFTNKDGKKVEVIEIYEFVPQNEVKTTPLDSNLSVVPTPPVATES